MQSVKKTYRTNLANIQFSAAESVGILACVQVDGRLTAVDRPRVITETEVEVTFAPEWQTALPEIDMDALAIVNVMGEVQVLLSFLLQPKDSEVKIQKPLFNLLRGNL